MDFYLKKIAADAGIVVGAWGVHGKHKGRHDEVCKMIENLHCLVITNGGFPKHPLYIKGDVEPRLVELHENNKGGLECCFVKDDTIET